MKCGSIEDGLLVFKKLPETSVVLWDVVICGHVQNAKFCACLLVTKTKRALLMTVMLVFNPLRKDMPSVLII